MIQLAVFQMPGVLQGGVRMSSRPATSHQQVTPAQVWPALSLDLRTRVIGLLAQLALNVLVARPTPEDPGKEVACVFPTTTAQNPS
jgi:hypothetical protein